MYEKDNLWDTGCCLSCRDRRKTYGCWCDECKCHSCLWYEETTNGYRFDGYKNGYCTFPSSDFDFNIKHEIKVETEKAYLIEFENYKPIWFPKKACELISELISGTDETGKAEETLCHWVRAKGWFLSLKMNELQEKDEEGDDALADLFCNTIEEGWNG